MGLLKAERQSALLAKAARISQSRTAYAGFDIDGRVLKPRARKRRKGGVEEFVSFQKLDFRNSNEKTFGI
jgi:23S rRNA G2445 N2-methylase RlmL